MSLVEQMEVAAAALIVGKQGVPGSPYDEQEVIRIIAERLNDAGYQTKAGKTWTKDIYSAWKRQADHKAKVDAAMPGNE